MSDPILQDAPQVLAVALNPAVDQTVVTSGLVPGAVNRALDMRIQGGGKGVNVASGLADAGVPTAVLGLLGRANAGIFEELFRAKGVRNLCIYTDRPTRINVKVLDTASGATTDLNTPGPDYGPAATRDLLARLEADLRRALGGARWVAFSGSLPPGFPDDAYARLLAPLAGSGCRGLLDASGAALKAAFWAGAHTLKPNRQELAELAGRPVATPADAAGAARELLAQPGAPARIVVSLGEDGALLVDGQGCLRAAPLPVQVGSSVGAGDAMVAGLLLAGLEDLPREGTLRLGVAFATARLRAAGADLPPLSTIRALADAVQVTPL